MALNQAQILFKKFIGGVSSTNNASPYYNEIAGASSGNVTLNRLWMLSQRIPAVNPFVPGDLDGTTYGAGVISENIDILEKVVIQLNRVQGTGGTTAAYAETIGDQIDGTPKTLGNRRFKNIINSFSYGVSYTVEVRDQSNNVINIYTPDNEGFLDVDSGILSFYGNNIYNGDFVTVTGYSYIGPVGDEVGLDIYASLADGVGSGGSGGGITQSVAKIVNVSSLPTAGNAYNGMFYLVGDGNDGVPGDPIRLNVTFDYGTNWYKWVLDSTYNQGKFIAVAAPGSINDNQLFTFSNGDAQNDPAMTFESPTRNSLIFVESNQVTLIDNLEQDAFTYDYVDSTYYQYSDRGSWEPKSFEKSANIELEQDATELTDVDGHPTGFQIPIRSGVDLDFIEISQMYNLETLTQARLNRNNFKLYLNGQKIDLFDDVEQDPVFTGPNPVDDYDDFFAAFGDYTPSFPVEEGAESDIGTSDPVVVTANTVRIDLTAANATVNDWFGIGSPQKINSDYSLKLDGFDYDFIDPNRLYYDETSNPLNGGDIYPFFFIELTDGVDLYYRKIVSYTQTGTGDYYEFEYDGADLNGTGLTAMRIIYFKRPAKITGGESLFWMQSTATYQISAGDEFVLNYLGDIEKSIVAKNKLNNLTTL